MAKYVWSTINVILIGQCNFARCNFDWSAHSINDRPKLLAHFYNALRTFFKTLTNKTNRLFLWSGILQRNRLFSYLYFIYFHISIKFILFICIVFIFFYFTNIKMENSFNGTLVNLESLYIFILVKKLYFISL
jgi:hypothetical protein